MRLIGNALPIPAVLFYMRAAHPAKKISDVWHSNSDYTDLYATVRDGGEEEKRSIAQAKDLKHEEGPEAVHRDLRAMQNREGIIAWKDMSSKGLICKAALWRRDGDCERPGPEGPEGLAGHHEIRNIQQLNTTSHRPQGDGSSERLFRSVLEELRVALGAEEEDGGKKWPRRATSHTFYTSDERCAHPWTC